MRAEKPAKSLITPSKKPQTAADSFTPPGLGPEPPAPPQITPAPPAIGSLVIDGVTVPVNVVPAAPVTFGPHVESPLLVAVGGKTMTLGVSGTWRDTVIAITTAAGGATVAIVGNTKNRKLQTFALNGGGGLANAAGNGAGGGGGDKGGAILSPTPATMPQQASRPKITAAGMTFTPAADGGFVVAGTLLSLGGPPVTIYGSANAGESAGSGSGSGSRSPGTKPSPTVLSLTTDTNGAEVLVVNGKTSALPTVPQETNKSNPTQNRNGELKGSQSASGPGLGSGPESTGTENISASESHKNSAPNHFSRTQKSWRFGTAMGFGIMALISW